MNLLTPYEFSKLYILDDYDLPLHTGYEIMFDFDDDKKHEVLGYVAVLRSVIDEVHLYIDHVCGGSFYVKRIHLGTFSAVDDISDGLVEFAKKKNKKPKFIVDCDDYFKQIGMSYGLTEDEI